MRQLSCCVPGDFLFFLSGLGLHAKDFLEMHLQNMLGVVKIAGGRLADLLLRQLIDIFTAFLSKVAKCFSFVHNCRA